MPVVTSHAPGTPSWSELSTTDEAGALSFYSALFGWVDEANEMGPNWYYHMQKVQDQYACSIYQQGEEERSQNVPPHWNIYFTVENVDNTMATITRNGGNVVFGPHDVFEAGRMAMCQDPQDAFFAIWQPKMHIGAGIKGEAGATCWHELLTTDQNAALDFYVATLGVERGPFMESSQYAMLNAGGTEVAGVMQMTPEMGVFPPHWAVYFGVENVDEMVARAQSLGATVYVPGTDIVPFEGQPAIGRFAALGDPQGAAFSIFQPLG